MSLYKFKVAFSLLEKKYPKSSPFIAPHHLLYFTESELIKVSRADDSKEKVITSKAIENSYSIMRKKLKAKKSK